MWRCLKPLAQSPDSAPIGAQIIAIARSYDDQMYGNAMGAALTPTQCVAELRNDPWIKNDAILAALERAVTRPAEPVLSPVYS